MDRSCALLDLVSRSFLRLLATLRSLRKNPSHFNLIAALSISYLQQAKTCLPAWFNNTLTPQAILSERLVL